jgi:site-specific recombinase XerD
MSGEIVDPLASVCAYLAAEKSDNTRRAYAADWADFHAWCERMDCRALPADPVSVARYVAQLADSGLKASTITRRCAAIRYAHKAAGREPPTGAEGVKAVLRGIRRTKGIRPNRKAPAEAVAIAAMLAALPNTLTGLRDRALLLIGFAAALRRSELVALQVADLERRRGGILLHIRRSKTDQHGRGQAIPVPCGVHLKPVAALDAWLAAAGIDAGPIFREVDRHGRVGAAALSGRSVARIVKRCAAAAGFDPAGFAGHSLRAGFVTQALADGVDPFKAMKITRHADPRTLAIYDRRAAELEDHAGKSFL